MVPAHRYIFYPSQDEHIARHTILAIRDWLNLQEPLIRHSVALARNQKITRNTALERYGFRSHRNRLQHLGPADAADN